MGLMSRSSGRTITPEQNLVQSVNDIVTTPLGTRVTVRDYGCNLPYMVDLPINRAWASMAFQQIATALDKWEPRLIVRRIGIDASQISSGIITMTLEAIYTPLGKIIRLENIALTLDTSLLAKVSAAS